MELPQNPEAWIEQNRARRAEIATQIRDLRYESDDLLAQEIAVRTELSRIAMLERRRQDEATA